MLPVVLQKIETHLLFFFIIIIIHLLVSQTMITLLESQKLCELIQHLGFCLYVFPFSHVRKGIEQHKLGENKRVSRQKEKGVVNYSGYQKVLFLVHIH